MRVIQYGLALGLIASSNLSHACQALDDLATRCSGYASDASQSSGASCSPELVPIVPSMPPGFLCQVTCGLDPLG